MNYLYILNRLGDWVLYTTGLNYNRLKAFADANYGPGNYTIQRTLIDEQR